MSEKVKHLDYRRFDGFCAIANLANIFRDEDILKFLDNDDYIPSNHHQLTKILHSEGYNDLFITPFIQFWDGYQINKQLIIDIITHPDIKIDDDAYFPFILNVKLKEYHTDHHAVSVLRFVDHYLFSDPVKHEYIKLQNVDEIFNYFHSCYAIHGFNTDKGKEGIEFVSLKMRNKFYE